VAAIALALKGVRRVNKQLLIDAAYHEAGHALLYESFEMPTGGIVIYADGTGKNWYSVSRKEAARDMTLIEKCKDACISLGGSAAQDIHDELGDPYSYLYYFGEQEDWRSVIELGLDEDLVNTLMKFTCKVLEEHWARLETLADALLKKHYQSPEEIRSHLAGVANRDRYEAVIRQTSGYAGAVSCKADPLGLRCSQ